MEGDKKKSKRFLAVFAIVFFVVGVLSTLIFQSILFKSYLNNEDVNLAPMSGGAPRQEQVFCVWIPCLNPLICGLAGYWLCSDGTTRSWDEMFPPKS